ncbi:hypothetical protein [Streptomyces sp. NPDC054838]
MDSATVAAQADASSALLHRIGKRISGPLASAIDGLLDRGEV